MRRDDDRPFRVPAAAFGWLALQVFPLVLVALIRRENESVASAAPAPARVVHGTSTPSDVPPPILATPTAADTARTIATVPAAIDEADLDDDETASRTLATARRLLADGDDEAAHAASESCLATDPTMSPCASIRAMTSMRHGEFARARAEVSECLRLNADDPSCIASDVTLRLRDHEIERASADVDHLRSLGPNSMSYELAAGMLARARGEDASAHDHFTAACVFGQPWACRQVERESDDGAVRDAHRRSIWVEWVLIAFATAAGNV